MSEKPAWLIGGIATRVTYWRRRSDTLWNSKDQGAGRCDEGLFTWQNAAVSSCVFCNFSCKLAALQLSTASQTCCLCLYSP
jgi:hypothetical protein